jgi:serine/threonine-protein kinase
MYLAEDEAGRRVALKELIFSLVPSIEALAAFEREASFLRRLNYPAIPHFVDSFQIGEGVHTRLYLAQEYIEGESLAGAIERGSLNESRVVDIARQVLRILVYIHGQVPKAIHRDIKPQNLILQPNGHVALVDFGAARDLSTTQTHGSTLVGTFGYMPRNSSAARSTRRATSMAWARLSSMRRPANDQRSGFATGSPRTSRRPSSASPPPGGAGC